MAHEKRERLSGMVEVLSGTAAGPRRFRMVANTGAEFLRRYGRAVADLSGMSVPKKLPILLNHDEDAVVGYADSHALTADGLVLEGSFVEGEKASARVQNLSDKGFPLTASVGVDIASVKVVEEGQSVRCNGRDFAGPIAVWAKSALFETSVVTANPADKNTSAQALAEDLPMTADEFAKANPEAVKAWKDEAAKAENVRLMSNLGALLKAIPGRTEFVLAQFSTGADVLTAKAALSDVLVAEAAEKAKTPAPAPSNPVLDSLKQKAGNPGLGFDGNAREQAVLNTEKLPPAQRAQAEFDAHPELAAQGVTVAALTAFYKAELRGQAKTDTVTRVAAAMSGGAV